VIKILMVMNNQIKIFNKDSSLCKIVYFLPYKNQTKIVNQMETTK